MAKPENTREIPLTRGHVAIVDAADYEWLSQWKWRASRSRNVWYAVRTGPRPARGTVYMHRQILACDEVDHEDGHGLHNWRKNLRVATHQQNTRNQKRLRRNKASRFPGVSRTGKKRWCGKIGVDGKTVWLGSHATEEAAFVAYREASLRYFGEFSPFA